MTYRADGAALESRCVALEKQLAELRARAGELESLQLRTAEIEQELVEARRMLETHGRPLSPLLENVRVASPCNADWDAMIGDDRVRFCGQCQKNVYNLSAMPRDEAEALLREKGEPPCVRFYRREDGTVLTADCPVGVRKKRVRRLAVLTVGGGAMAAASLVMSGRGEAQRARATLFPLAMSMPAPAPPEVTPARPPEMGKPPAPHVKMGKYVPGPDEEGR